MRALVLTLLCFMVGFCQVAHSDNWISVDQGVNKNFWNEKLCKKRTNGLCLYKDGKNMAYHDIADVLVDDLEKPIFRAPKDSPLQGCDDFLDCKSMTWDKNSDGVLNDAMCVSGETAAWDETSSHPDVTGISKPWFIWCKKILSYEKKTVKRLVLNQSKKDSYDAEKAQKAQEDAIVIQGSSALDVGRKAKAMMVGYIKLKNLPKAARKALRGDLKSIIEALDVGSIDVAIDEIKALIEDPVVVTPEAKALILKIFSDAGYDIS